MVQNLSSFKNVGIFTSQLAVPVKGDPFNEVSNIIHTDGLISGDEIRISTFVRTPTGIKENRILVMVTVP